MKSIQEKNICQFIQGIEESSYKPEMSVISKKYNPHFFLENPAAENTPLTVKKIIPENISCQKLQKYYEQGRLAVIIRNMDGQGINRFIFSNDRLPVNVSGIRVLTKHNSFSSTKPLNINSLDKKSIRPSEEENGVLNEIRDNILFYAFDNISLEKLSKEEYLELFDYCLNIIEGVPSQAKIEKENTNTKKIRQYAISQNYDDRFESLITGVIGCSLVNTINNIILSHYESIREADKEEAIRKQEDIRSYEKLRDQILYHVKLCLIKAQQEEKGVEQLEILKNFLKRVAEINLL